VIAGNAQGNKAFMLPGPRSMLAAMVATAILVTPIGIALIPAPTDSYPQPAGFPQVEQPFVPQELELNVKRQASARRAAELTKLLTLAESAVSTTPESSNPGSDAFDGRTSPQIKTPETQGIAVNGGTSVSAPLPSQRLPACTDVQRSAPGPETMNANAQPETGATVAEVEPAIEPATVTPRTKSLRARLHTRRRIRLTRGSAAKGDAPPAATQSNRNSNGARGTVSTSPIAPPASGDSRGSAF
jgi:hypothetical protein